MLIGIIPWIVWVIRYQIGNVFKIGSFFMFISFKFIMEVASIFLRYSYANIFIAPIIIAASLVFIWYPYKEDYICAVYLDHIWNIERGNITQFVDSDKTVLLMLLLIGLYRVNLIKS